MKLKSNACERGEVTQLNMAEYRTEQHKSSAERFFFIELRRISIIILDFVIGRVAHMNVDIKIRFKCAHKF